MRREDVNSLQSDLLGAKADVDILAEESTAIAANHLLLHLTDFNDNLYGVESGGKDPDLLESGASYDDEFGVVREAFAAKARAALDIHR
jgi:hypothetical protein